MPIRLAPLFVLLLAVIASATHRAAGQTSSYDLPAAALTDQHITAATDAIRHALQTRRSARYHWDPRSWDARIDGSATQKGGYTALAVLALLHSGTSYQDERLRDTIEWLEKAELTGTYAVSTRAAVWAHLPPKYRPLLQRDIQWLLDGFSPTAGGWTYEQKPRTTLKDNSIRQFGALAFWEASRRDIGIDREYWTRIEEELLATQLDDGGWNYKSDLAPPRGSMTCAGLATLFITQDLLHGPEYVKLRRARGTQPLNEALDRGLKWMNEHFDPTENPGSFRDYFYYAWGVERVGLASGRRSFAGKDWFRTCAAEVIHRLCVWDPEAGTMTVHERMRGRANGTAISVRHLSFALLFLSRGQVPIALAKLELPETNWNNRPRDVANLTRALSTAAESEYNWQIVSLDDPVERWLESPVLVIASNEALPFAGENDGPRRRGDAPPRDAAADRARMKTYLDRGGLLFAWADGGNRGFTRSVEALGSALYPDAKWRDLPQQHPIYTLHRTIDRRRPKLRALSNGVRELIILGSKPDIGATFQTRDEARGAALYTMAANLFFYASGKGDLKPRLATAEMPHTAPSPATMRPATIAIARHAGNWNPEPAALERFTLWCRQTAGLAITIVETELKTIDQMTPPADLILVRGTAPHSLTPDESAAIERFLEQPRGVLLFETPGGRGGFTESIETALTALLDRPLTAPRAESVITGDGISGFDLSHVRWRPYSFEVFGTRETIPRLQAMRDRGAPRILFSREDLSHGLLDQACWTICGYAPESARELLANCLLAGMKTAE